MSGPKRKSSLSGGNAGSGLGVAGPWYFYEDEVYRVTKAGDVEFGMVTENWEMYSSDEEDSDPDKIPNGSVAVTWHPKGKEEVLPEPKVKLSDRSLMPGDVVRRLIFGKDTQRGYCRAVKVAADVQIVGTKKIIPGVLAMDLQPVQKLQADVAVYLDSWIGMVRDMVYNVSLKFSDGSACRVDSNKLLDKFEDTRKNADGYNSSDVFYPGQKLSGAIRHLKDAEWSHYSDELKRAKDRKLVTVTVVDVKPVSMTVQWQWQTPESVFDKPNNKEGNNKDKNHWQKDPPSDVLDEKDIKRVKILNLFESCTVQLGDITFYTPKSKDDIMDKSEWKKLLAKCGVHRAVGSKREESASNEPSKERLGNSGDENGETDDAVNSEPETEGDKADNPDADQKIETKDVLLNGSAPTKKPLPKVSIRSLGKKKLKKARRQPQVNVSLGTPVVVETIHTQSTVDIVWQDGTIEEGMRSIDLYPIHHLDDHEFFPGDFVVKADSTDFCTYGVIQSMDHSGRVATVKWFESYTGNEGQLPKELNLEEVSVYDIKDHPDYRFRPGTIVIRVANMTENQLAAGQILDNDPEGQVRVWWANGVTNSCWPQDLFRLGDYDSDEGEMWGDHVDLDDEDEDGCSDSSWETEAEEEMQDADASQYSQRYQTIGKHIEQIQKALVCIREKVVASSPVVAPVESDGEKTSNPSLTVDRRKLAKQLLMVYKDCQYLDKIMGSKYFDEDFLKTWFKQMEASSKTGRMTEEISKLFELPDTKSSPLARSESYCSSKPDEEHNTKTETEDDLDANGTTPTGASCVCGGEDSSADSGTKTQTIFVTELCSVILQKLLSAHKEYETRFGSKNGDVLRHSKGAEAFRLMATIVEELTGHVARAKSWKKSLQGGSIGADVADSQEVENITVNSGDLDQSLVTEDIKPDLDKSKEETPVQAKVASDKQEAGVPAKLSEQLGISKDKLNNNASEDALKVNFSIIDNVPDTHSYRVTSFMPSNPKSFTKTIQKEITLLRNSLPDGIYVKGYEDRMDLFSALICGPENTPYEDGIFLFDIQLPPAYPSTPPSVHYVSFCPDRLNPNLYECGKVCVSLLGTWNGKGTEVWTSSSSLLQLLVSIQGLILVSEPYYNEAGYEKQKGSQQGEENSRMYNEMVLIKLVQSMSRMLVNRHAPWENEIGQFISQHYKSLINRYNKWLQMSETASSATEDLPGFPLLPVSKGFAITLKKTLENFAKICDSFASGTASNATSNTNPSPMDVGTPISSSENF